MGNIKLTSLFQDVFSCYWGFLRILLIEDDPATSKSIELMLGHANFNVYTTDLGEEGIDLAKLYDYDLILLDLVLPDINGHDVLRQLRVARIDTPILILSGETDTENKMRGFGSGADDYLTKPFHRLIVFFPALIVVAIIHSNKKTRAAIQETNMR